MTEQSLPEESIFLQALELRSHADRAAFLERACGENCKLRTEVEALLRANQKSGDLLDLPESPALAKTINEPTPKRPFSEGPGSEIGAYRLLEQIGEGGFGVVFMAEQMRPVKRRVALKVIKPGMDTRQVIARFEAERQALALMEHPNIAKVFDGGTTPSGRPYFVMELVVGAPITEYCDRSQLAPRDRLELFTVVCQAVQHAHQKGIVHRDIKLSNVLVALHDDRPVVKVIDFGIAKATSGLSLTDKTLLTGFAQMVGTPLYMSPEQAELSGVDVDTRSDIYSLGVLLYELLTGTTPFDKERLKAAAYDEIRRIIREEEPQRPSTRLNELSRMDTADRQVGKSSADSHTTSLASISAVRRMEPRKLTQLLRADLDWIVMKALEKDRSRRYATANGLAADVQKYLADEPVEACPPSAAYRFRKFARRNKAGLATAAAAGAALVVAVVGLAMNNVLVTAERDQKVRALIDKETALEEKGQALGEKIAALEKAEENYTEAKRQEGLAKAHERTAQANESLARRRFYAAQMNLATQAWDTGQRARALELVEGQRPRLEQQDLRSFEWYYLWQLCNQECRSTRRDCRGVAYSPDGQIVATKNLDFSIRLLQATTGQEQAILRGHTDPLWAMEFSPDGKTLASGSQDGVLKLWDVPAGKERKLQRLVDADYPVRSLAFTSDGKTLAVASRDISLWDMATGELQTTLAGSTSPQEAFLNVDFAPDGKTIAAGSSYSFVRLWTLEGDQWKEGLKLPEHHWGPPVAFAPDGKTLATGSRQKLKLWDVVTGKELAALPGHNDNILSVAFSPDGKLLTTGSEDRTVRLWDVDMKQELAQYPHYAAVYSVLFSPDGKLVISTSGDNTVKTWEVAPATSSDRLQHLGPVTGLSFSPDSATLYSGGRYLTKAWNVLTGLTFPSQGYKGHIGAEGFAISADRKSLAVRYEDKTVKLWSLATGQELGAFVVPSEFNAVAISPDGKTIAMWHPGSGGVKVMLWDVATGQPTMTLTGEGLSVRSAAFSSDGKSFAAGIQFFSVHVWDVSTGRLKLTLTQDARAQPMVISVVFSPDSQFLVAGNQFGSARLWDLETGKFRTSFKGHTSAIRGLAFTPDGETLATASDDTSVKLWDVATGQERITLRGHKSAVKSLAFAPDGNTLATGSTDGTVRLWRAATDPEARARKNPADPDDPDGPLSWSRAGDQLRSNGKLREADEAYQRAIELYTEAIEFSPEKETFWKSRGYIYSRLSQWREAIADYTKVNELNDGFPTVWRVRGDAYAELGLWKEAAADFARSIELKNDDSQVWYRRGLTLLELRELNEYRTLCADMLAQPGRLLTDDSAHWVVWTCVLAADAVSDWTVPLQLADSRVVENPKDYRALNNQGALLCRAGQLEKALERLLDAEVLQQSDTSRQNAVEYNLLFQSMARQRLAQFEKARELYDRAVQSFDRELQKLNEPGAGNPPPWNRRLTFELLRREVEELFVMKKRG